MLQSPLVKQSPQLPLYTRTQPLSTFILKRRWTRLQLILLGVVVLYGLYYGFLHIVVQSEILHPIPELMRKALLDDSLFIASQSKTLEQAIGKYEKFYHRRPPKGFDQWFELALKFNSKNIDHYTDIYESLLPYWGMTPDEVRTRQEGLDGIDLGRLKVRNGWVVTWESMSESERSTGHNTEARKSLEDMLWALNMHHGVRLPDFDMFVNGLDEPRVIVPYEVRSELEKLAQKGQTREPVTETLRLHNVHYELRNTFDIQRQACPPSSAARIHPISPEPGAYPIISNTFTSHFTTARGKFLSKPKLEINYCQHPDVQDLHAFFIDPLTFTYTDQLFPVFGQSKPFGFNDILIPAWWYWYKPKPYIDTDDLQWEDKLDTVYWRGSSTGGWSMSHNYRGWLRNRAVAMFNRPFPSPPSTTVLNPIGNTPYALQTNVSINLLNSAFTDIAFTAVDQGTGDSLDNQKAEPNYRFTPKAPYADIFRHKMAIDFDGTAFSGRFYALMESNSAVVKARIFKEWADDTLTPWLHYIPLSLRLQESYNLFAFFFGLHKVVEAAERGQCKASGCELLPQQKRELLRSSGHDEALRKIAEAGKEWYHTRVRHEDMMLYIYRLALEWARVTSDDREKLHI